MNRKLTKKVVTPNVRGNIKLSTYETLAIGEVPKFDFVMRSTPNPIKNNPATKTKYLLIILKFTNSDILLKIGIKPRFFKD